MCLAIGFLTQCVSCQIVPQIGFIMTEARLPDKAVDVVGFLLLPGVQLFWREGFHSNLPFGGLILAVTLNTLYYTAIIGLILLGRGRFTRSRR